MLKITTLATLLPGLAFAATMTNDITGVGPNGSVKPYICIQNENEVVTLALAPGKSGDANKASGNKGYAGATIRFGGCDKSDSYLGYIGFLISESGNNSAKNYQPPKGVHVAFNNPDINSTGHVTGSIDYTPIEVNSNLTKAEPGKKWLFTGINLSGLEFGKSIDPVVIPNLSEADSSFENSDLKETEEFIKAGVNTVRVPVSWGFLQLEGPGKGGINLAYYNNYLRPLLQTLTKAQVNTIVDLHAYMRYSKFGEQYSGCAPNGGPCPDGTLITDENAYKSIWGQLAKLIQNDPQIDQKFMMFDLMNEPVDVPNDKVFTIQASLINMLQEQKFDGYLLVEGNNWTGLHSWAKQWTGSDNQVYSNATLFTRENFNKQGINDLSKVVINVHQYLDSNFSGTADTCQQDLSKFNLQEFTDYLSINKFQAMVTEFGTGRDASSCKAPLTAFMHYLEDNSAKGKDYGFIGWTIWSAGHGWGTYNLRVQPSSYQMDVLKEFL
ncbi:MAG: cellulase family glycosylhydrolase [Tatlockia sp.]|nr:cellulase family glycosylhydrolase [Tatlockia sp.]